MSSPMTAIAEKVLFHKTYLHPTSQEWVVFVHGAGGSSSIMVQADQSVSAAFQFIAD